MHTKIKQKDRIGKSNGLTRRHTLQDIFLQKYEYGVQFKVFFSFFSLLFQISNACFSHAGIIFFSLPIS